MRAVYTACSAAAKDKSLDIESLNEVFHGFSACERTFRSALREHGTTVDDVIVLEPPHRSDRPDVPIYKNALRINELRKDPARATLFNEELGALLERYGA